MHRYTHIRKHTYIHGHTHIYIYIYKHTHTHMFKHTEFSAHLLFNSYSADLAQTENRTSLVILTKEMRYRELAQLVLKGLKWNKGTCSTDEAFIPHTNHTGWGLLTTLSSEKTGDTSRFPEMLKAGQLVSVSGEDKTQAGLGIYHDESCMMINLHGQPDWI